MSPNLLQHHCRLLHGNVVTITERWVCSLYDPFWRFYRNCDDGAVIIGDNGEIPMRAGASMLVPAWGRFQTRCIGSVRHTYLHFDPVNLPGNWVRTHCTAVIPLPRCAEWDKLLDVFPITDENAWSLQLRCQAMLCSALALVIDQAGGAGSFAGEVTRSADRTLVEPAVRWIEEHLAEPLPVELLANRCAVSRDHFTRIFTRAMGSSPARHVAERRITAAALLLLRTEDRIETIAEAVGFTNRYHFTRVFQRILCTSPAAYRNQGRLG